MPPALQSSDRKLLIAAAVLLLVIGAVSTLGETESGGRFPAFSSYSTAKDGAKAAYLLLQESGFAVERWDQPLERLPQASGESGVVLILAAPKIPESKLAVSEEEDGLERFLRNGGRVIAAGAEAASILPQASRPPALHEEKKPASDENADEDEAETAAEPPSETHAAIAPSAITRGAPIIEMKGAPMPQVSAESRVVEYADRAVISYRVDSGEVIWWADGFPLTNAGLRRASNLELFLNSVRSRKHSPAATRILWDEHFHGETADLSTYLMHTPLPWLAAQVLLVFAAMLVTLGRRHGPLVSLNARKSRLSPLEFVETLGDLYTRKHAAPEALETVYQGFRFLAARRLGIPPGAAPESLAAAASTRFAPEPALVDLLRECDHAERFHDVQEKRALWLVGELHSLAAKWGL